MKITFYGHSCFGLQIGGKSLLFDPFISPNPKASHIEINQIPCDYMLISHGHGDHIADAMPILQSTQAKVVSNYEIVTWLGNQGVENSHPLNHGGSWNFDFGKITYVNAVHSSSFPDGSYAGNPGGFIIEAEGKTVYYSGDTALTYDMKMFGELYDIDIAFLCMGDNFTMGTKDASIAASWLNCDTIVGMHFDTFGYIEIDHAATKALFSKQGKTLHLLEIGQQMEG